MKGEISSGLKVSFWNDVDWKTSRVWAEEYKGSEMYVRAQKTQSKMYLKFNMTKTDNRRVTFVRLVVPLPSFGRAEDDLGNVC